MRITEEKIKFNNAKKCLFKSEYNNIMKDIRNYKSILVNNVKYFNTLDDQCEDEIDRVMTSINVLKLKLKDSLMSISFYKRYLSKFYWLKDMEAITLMTYIKPYNIYSLKNLFSYAGINGPNNHGKKYNVILKDFLNKRLGPKLVEKSSYGIYYWTKYHRLMNNGFKAISHKGIHKRAMRYMIQKFLKDYYFAFLKVYNFPEIKPLKRKLIDLKHIGEDLFDYSYILDRSNRYISNVRRLFHREIIKINKLFIRS